jgi:hypothetical protein
LDSSLEADHRLRPPFQRSRRGPADHRRDRSPYNVEWTDENRLQISVALTGFTSQERALTVEQIVLTVQYSISSRLEATMLATTANGDNVFDPNSLLHPGTVFTHTGVLSDPVLAISEKIILGSWASDVSAISSFPALRAPDGLKAPVTIDEILDAICALDEGPHNPSAGRPMRLRSTERSAAF